MFSTALALLRTPVHATIFPYPWATTLHASRISMVFHTNLRNTNSRLSWGAHLLGFLLMCWGGSLTSHLLLSLPPPQLYALGPWINYSAVHLLFTVLFHYFPIPDPSIHKHSSLPSRWTSPLPLLVTSPLFHFILGATASAGGGLLGGTFSLWTPNWQFSTPPPLRTGVWGFWSTLDIWAGGVVAVTYGILAGHPAFLPLRTSFAAKPLPVVNAQTTAAAIMVVLFGLRVAAMASKAAKAPVAAKEKVKTQ
ncbi:hypothetical protein B0H16DRAFT_1709874 [Mycena metata]|uniref:Uncharacterized protein n=1 Tax=Mycena metata TaxID=1033252 RepID=A0AAD7KED5_9AGAR|nr:hypothetical protein B0H16DRAFT_1709874 [Mycena metata]